MGKDEPWGRKGLCWPPEPCAAGPRGAGLRSGPGVLPCRDDNVQRELRDWGLSFDSNLLSFSGRILQAEKIHQGGKTVRCCWKGREGQGQAGAHSVTAAALPTPSWPCARGQTGLPRTVVAE